MPSSACDPCGDAGASGSGVIVPGSVTPLTEVQARQLEPLRGTAFYNGVFGFPGGDERSAAAFAMSTPSRDYSRRFC